MPQSSPGECEAFVRNLSGRQVAGFAMGDRTGAQLVADALRMAWFRRRPAPGLIFHSGRGSQYAGNLFAAQIEAFKMRASTSRKGDCRDDAVAGSLFGSPEGESLDRHDFGTRRAASDEIMAWIATMRTPKSRSDRCQQTDFSGDLHPNLAFESQKPSFKVGNRLDVPCHANFMHFMA